jgi:predicted RNA binding protein YcfA (HicA-like mRNA interferase family)
MKISPRVLEALRDEGAVLVRTGKHYVYRLPNHRNVVISISPSCKFAERKQLQDIRRQAKC